MTDTGDKNRFLRLLRPDSPSDGKAAFLAKALASAYREAHRILGHTEEARKRASFIAESSRLIGAKLDYATTLERAATQATPFLGDWCLIDILETPSRLSRAAIGYQDSSEEKRENPIRKEPLTEELQLFNQEVIRRREPLTLKSADNPCFFSNFQGFDIQTAILLPLVLGENEIGLMTLLLKANREFPDGLYMTAMEYATRVSMAIEHSKLHWELQKALKARDEFISIAGHELQNPLSVLRLQLGMLELLWNQESSPSYPRAKFLKTKESIERAIDKLSNSIDDVFDVSRMRNNQFKIARNQVNLTQLLEDTVARVSPLLRATGCEARLDLEPQVTGYLDKGRIEQVTINLITNATKYAPNGPIEVALRLKDQRARISVKDFGPGISKENQMCIFEPFERLDSRAQIKGLGLGLYICKKIVTAHGGKLWVESEPNQGASFEVDLPLDESALSPERETGATS